MTCYFNDLLKLTVIGIFANFCCFSNASMMASTESSNRLVASLLNDMESDDQPRWLGRLDRTKPYPDNSTNPDEMLYLGLLWRRLATLTETDSRSLLMVSFTDWSNPFTISEIFWSLECSQPSSFPVFLALSLKRKSRQQTTNFVIEPWPDERRRLNPAVDLDIQE